MQSAAELLDELMGRNRNEDNPDAEIHSYKDARVCRSMLCGFCPYDLFANTKEDAGACPYECHDVKFKAAFDKERTKDGKEGDGWHPWENEFLRVLETFVAQCERTIERGERRLEASGEGAAPRVNLESAAEVAEVTTQIEEAIKKAEAAGEEGDVDESMRLMEEVEELKAKKAAMQAKVLQGGKAAGEGAAGTVNQKLRVCEVCGAMLSIFDSDSRLADHFGGKIHLGHSRIRETVKKLKERRDAARGSRSRDDRDRRGRDSSRHRGHHSRDRDRDRDRDRKHGRSRDRDHRRSRSSRDDGHRRHRSRDRSRDRSRHRRRSKDRSRSRDRRRRSKSRSRSRSRHRRR